MCLGSGALRDAAVAPCLGKGSDEQSLLREILDTVETGDILLGDAFYATYFLLWDLISNGVDGVFEQYGARKRSTDFSTGEMLGVRDHVITLPKPKKRPEWMSPFEYDRAPESLRVRELEVSGKILVTTFLDPQATPKRVLKALYRQRWQVELDVRNIKTTLGMEQLHCKTPEMALKELSTYLLAYNLIRLLMAQSALLADQIPRQLTPKQHRATVAGLAFPRRRAYRRRQRAATTDFDCSTARGAAIRAHRTACREAPPQTIRAAYAATRSGSRSCPNTRTPEEAAVKNIRVNRRLQIESQ